MRVLAPAKLNLGLRIVGRRADGYHELESVFVPIDLADEIGLDIRTGEPPEVGLVVSGAGDEVPADARNLAFRAARSFLDVAGLRARVRISLVKRIPAAAGLGGGSSDAAAVLRGLSEHFPAALGRPGLEELALGLGADVPFFLDPRPALVSGIGERRAPLPGRLPRLAVLLANPGEPVPTARVFAAHARAAKAFGPSGRLAQQLAAALAGPSESLAGRLQDLVENDLDAAAEMVCPAIARVRAALRGTGALAVGMSGSGGTLYGIFATASAAEAALARLSLPAPAWVRLARSVEAR